MATASIKRCADVLWVACLALSKISRGHLDLEKVAARFGRPVWERNGIGIISYYRRL